MWWDQIVTWKIVKATGTATGASELTPVNMNLASWNSADAVVRGNGNVGWFTAWDTIAQFRVGAGDVDRLDFDGGLILWNSDAIAFEADDVAAEASVEITLVWYFDAL
jgi:hypothetical protein